MQKDKKFYDNFFKKWGANIHDNPERFLKVSELCKGRVLDVACGTGNLSDFFLGDYVGVDISDQAIAMARSVRRPGAQFFVQDFTTPLNPDIGEYDTIYLGEFLEHIEDDRVVFENIMRFAKNNGLIIISVPNGDRIPDESHCRTFTIPEIRKKYSKYGKLTFVSWTGFRDRILFTIELGSINQDLISLVMIAKDEEKGLENAIISALPLVDSVVVSIDSQTTDKTAKIAELYADELKVHEWKDDFSAARNFASENVKSNWILFLDGHEYIEKIGDIESKLLLDVDGILVTIKMENGSSFMYPRIYRNGIKMENAVHNAPDCKTIQHAPKFVIVHDRTGSQSIEAAKARAIQRNRMIPKLMKQCLKDNKNDQRALFNLGNWYMTALDFRLALYYYKRCYKLTPSPDERYFLKAQIGIAHLLKGNNLRALWSFYDLEKLIPDRWETRRLIGGAYMQQGRYKMALKFLVEALDPNKFQYMYQLFGQDFAEIWDLIGACFNALEQYPQAVISWQQASSGTEDKNRKGFYDTKARLAALLVKNPNAELSGRELDEMTPFLKKQGSNSV